MFECCISYTIVPLFRVFWMILVILHSVLQNLWFFSWCEKNLFHRLTMLCIGLVDKRVTLVAEDISITCLIDSGFFSCAYWRDTSRSFRKLQQKEAFAGFSWYFSSIIGFIGRTIQISMTSPAYLENIVENPLEISLYIHHICPCSSEFIVFSVGEVCCLGYDEYDRIFHVLTV